MNNNIDQFRKSFETLLNQKSPAAHNRKSHTAMAKLVPVMESRQDSNHLFDSAELPTTQEEHTAQRIVRQWFGKETAVNQGLIGCHPDFVHLEGTDEKEYHHITTMFIDIKNSTRLALRYSLEEVQHIKNSILRAASEMVRAMDGHVHRFMGDALMAYFGRRGQSKESTAMAAISCATMLRTFMQQVVVPTLDSRQIDAKDLGFRIGIDFGDDKDVLWSSYGFSEVNEVTATSFFVDASAKLQSMASKDGAMLGHNLINLLDFPEVLTSQKFEQRDGRDIPVDFLRPNYRLSDGSPMNYVIRELNYNKFSALLPLPTELKQQITSDILAKDGVNFCANILNQANGKMHYPSMSQCLPKNMTIQFALTLSPRLLGQLNMPMKCKFTKQNYGCEAENQRQTKPEIIEYPIRSIADSYFDFERETAFRGVHVVTAELIDRNGKLIFRDSIGIHIS